MWVCRERKNEGTNKGITYKRRCLRKVAYTCAQPLNFFPTFFFTLFRWTLAYSIVFLCSGPVPSEQKTNWSSTLAQAMISIFAFYLARTHYSNEMKRSRSCNFDQFHMIGSHAICLYNFSISFKFNFFLDFYHFSDGRL